MKALYEESETAEVFTWTPPSNNQAHVWQEKFSLRGKMPFPITRQSEREKAAHRQKHHDQPGAERAPVRRIAAEHVMNCYVVWEFAENKEGAQQFLIDYVDAFP